MDREQNNNKKKRRKIKCHWLCKEEFEAKDAEVWLYDPMYLDFGPVPLCNECHELRDPLKRLRFEPIITNQS